MRTLSRRGIEVVPAWAWAVAAIAAGPVLVVWATTNGSLLLLAAAAIGVAGIVLTIAKPMSLLLIYVALIPIEAVVVLGDAATLTRALGAGFFAGYVLGHLGRIRRDALPTLGAAFAGWAALSSIWALNADVTLTQVVTLGQLVLMTWVIADFVSADTARIRPILWAYSGAATLVAVGGLADVLLAGGSFDRASAFEAQGPAHLAAVLLPAFFFILFESLRRGGPNRLWLPLLIITLAVLLSGTRSAWLAVTLTFLIAVVPRLGRRTTLPALLLGLILVAVAQVPEVGAFFDDRLSTALETGGAGRVDIWSVGLGIFAGNPIIGVGYENFPVAFTPEIIRGTEVPGLNLGILIPGLAPHSIVVGTLAELGVVGAMLLAGFLGTLILRPVPREWARPLKAMLVAILIQALFLDLLGRKQLWLIIALIIGAGLAEADQRRQRRDGELVDHERVVARLRQTWAVER